jgi:hypothetical protein
MSEIGTGKCGVSEFRSPAVRTQKVCLAQINERQLRRCQIGIMQINALQGLRVKDSKRRIRPVQR